MADLNIKVDSWKNKLLDMGKRNKLLNYKDTKRGTLRFKNPSILALWNSFVVEENPIVFPLVDEEDETENENLTDVNQSSIESIEDDSNQSEMSRHQGYHSVYNEVVERQLSKMDVNQSVDVLEKQVYDLQQNLRYLQEQGLPLYPSQGATVDLWERQLSKLK